MGAAKKGDRRKTQNERPQKQAKKTDEKNSSTKQSKRQSKKTGQKNRPNIFLCQGFSGGGFSQKEDEYQACLGNVISFTIGIWRLSACFEKVTKNEEIIWEYKNSCVCRTKKRRNMSIVSFKKQLAPRLFKEKGHISSAREAKG